MSQSRSDVVRALGQPDVILASAGDEGVFLRSNAPFPKGWKVNTISLYYLDVRLEVAISADGTIKKSSIGSESEVHLREIVRHYEGK
jgi:hypothetical protein